MKKLSITSVLTILCILISWLISTRPVDNTPFYNTAYYSISQQRIEFLENKTNSAKDQLHAGFSKVSITPLLHQGEENLELDKFDEIPLAGYGDRKGAPAAGIHDCIFIRAAALKAGIKEVIMVSADLLIIPPDITDSLTSYLHRIGINREQIFLAATHTHSSLGAWGGGIAGRKFSGEENENLKTWLTIKFAKAITKAIEDLKPASFSSGNFNAGEFTRNRLVDDKGTKNDDFSYILIKQHGHKDAILGSFSAHATTLGKSNMEVSADYPGYWARYLEGSFTDFALFFAGSMGSQSPISKGEGFNKASYLGEELAKRLVNTIDTSSLSNEILLTSISLELPLPPYRFRLTTKRTLTTWLTKKLMPYPDNAVIQAIRLNNTIWISTPADFSGEYAVQVQDRLSAQGFESNITSFNGSYLGYIIPGRYFYLDKYEPKTMGWYGPWMGDYTMDLIRQLTNTITETEHHLN